MTQTAASAMTDYLDRLDQAARAANVAEDNFRRDISKRIAELERARAFAFRRLNIMKSLASAVVGAKDEAEASALGAEAFMRELDWTGATESQRETIEHFKPVTAAVWNASRPEAGEETAKAVEREMEAFEKWFGESRSDSFLSLMDKDLPELPLVEIA